MLIVDGSVLVGGACLTVRSFECGEQPNEGDEQKAIVRTLILRVLSKEVLFGGGAGCINTDLGAEGLVERNWGISKDWPTPGY